MLSLLAPKMFNTFTIFNPFNPIQHPIPERRQQLDAAPAFLAHSSTLDAGIATQSAVVAQSGERLIRAHRAGRGPVLTPPPEPRGTDYGMGRTYFLWPAPQSRFWRYTTAALGVTRRGTCALERGVLWTAPGSID